MDMQHEARRRRRWVAAGLAAGAVAAVPLIPRAGIPTIDVSAIAQIVDSISVIARQTQQLVGIGIELGEVQEILGTIENVSWYKESTQSALAEGRYGDAFDNVQDILATVGAGVNPRRPAHDAAEEAWHLSPHADPDGVVLHQDDREYAPPALPPEPMGRNPRFATEQEVRSWMMSRYYLRGADAGCRGEEAGGDEACGNLAPPGVDRRREVLQSRHDDLRQSAVESYVLAAKAEAMWKEDEAVRAKISERLGEASSLREEVSLLVNASLHESQNSAFRNRLAGKGLEMQALIAIGGSEAVVTAEGYDTLRGEEAPGG